MFFSMQMKIEINFRDSRKCVDIWTLNNIPLNEDGNSEQVKKKLEKSKDDSTTYRNFQDTAKAVVKGMFVAISTCIKKLERH